MRKTFTKEVFNFKVSCSSIWIDIVAQGINLIHG